MASIYDVAAGLNGLCDTVLHEATEIIKLNNPFNSHATNGTIDSLMSPMNKAGATTIELQKPNGTYNGRYRIVYDNRALASEVGTDLDCEIPDDRTRDFEEEIDITQTLQTKGFTMQWSEWQFICANRDTMLQKFLATDMAAGREALNQRTALRIASNAIGVNLGNLVSGVPSANAKLVNIFDSTRANRSQGMADMFYDLVTNQLTGPPIVVSRGNLELYRLQQQWGCCNEFGIDESKVGQYISQSGMAFYLDHYAETAYGENVGLVYMPGAIQLITVNRFEGMWGANIAGTRTFVISDPVVPGLKWDVIVMEVPCADGTGMPAYSIKLQLNWDISSIPAEAFAADDPLRGMTNAFLYEFGKEA